MPLTRSETEWLNNALGSIQADLEAQKIVLQCFLVNAMSLGGRAHLLDQLMAQAKFLVAERQPTGISPQEAEMQRAATLEALERLMADLQLARAAMERTDDPSVN